MWTRPTDYWAIAFQVDHSKLPDITGLPVGATSEGQFFDKVNSTFEYFGFRRINDTFYTTEKSVNALVRVYQAIQQFAEIPEGKCMKNMYFFSVDGGLNVASTLFPALK